MTLLEPFESCVYQRGIDNTALIPVSGKVAAGLTDVSATFSPLNGGQKITQTIPVDKDGNYGSAVAVPAGWYALTVVSGLDLVQVTRVGAGEVLIVFGHSFMQGGHDTTHQLPSTDERVVTLLDGLENRGYQFGQLKDKVGPFHGTSDSWGQLGDLLVKQYNCPVLIYGCAYGGTNLQMNLEVIDGLPLSQLPPGYAGAASRQPFAPLEDVLNNYVPKTGVRAILMEHGYNDRGTSKETYVARLKRFTDYIRQHWQKPDLAFVLVQEQLTAVAGTLYDIPTAQAQQEFIRSGYKIFAGPDFNTPAWDGKFAEHDHLFGPAIDLFAQQWANSLKDSFLSNSTPYAPTVLPDVFPAVLFNAPVKTEINALDWVILAGLGVCLVGVFFWKSKYLIWAFLALGLIAMARLNGKL
jgi:hypothetical protein